MDYYVIPKRIRARAEKEGLVAILGVSKGTIQRNIIEPLQRIWGTKLVGDINSQNICPMFGEDVYCLGAEKVSQVSKIRGSSLKYCYGDEVVDWNQDVFNMLKSRLDKPYSCFDGACNPDAPQHWFKKFLDSDADIYCQKYEIFDNPFLSRVFVDELCKEYKGTVLYDRYIRGLWVLAEGLVYDFFGEGQIADEVPGKGEYYISCDYGTLNPFSAGLWCWDGKMATRVREYYYSGRENQRNKTDEEYYTDLEALAGDLPVRAAVVDPSAASFIETIRRHGRFKVRKAHNEVVPGIMTTARMLRDGTVKIHRSCKDAIREFGLYRWDDKAAEDRPVKENDHAMDDIRYFCQTILRHKAGKPEYVPLYQRG